MPELSTLNGSQQTNGCHAAGNNSKCCKGKSAATVDANNNGVEAVEQSCCKKSTTGVQYSNGKETTPYKPVTHVIFDLDGLLIDSEQRFANAIAILLKRFGIAEYSKELQEKVLGMEVARGIEEIIKSTGIPITVAEFMVMEREIYSEEMLKVELMPGASRLVEHLKRHRIPMAIATGSTSESYLIKTQRHQELFTAGKYFQHIVFTRDDAEVKRPKPAPDVYLITARRFADSPPPSACLVFEDSHIGVDGARAAGMQVVMVPDHRFTCKQENATQVLYSLEHFQPQLYGLPPFDE